MQNSDAALRPCLGCGGMVPDIQGPVHAYMRSSPGCWEWYGELNALSGFRTGATPEVRSCIADCFAVQHPGGAEIDRRQRGSVAVHLIALYLVRWSTWRAHHATVCEFARAALDGAPARNGRAAS